jgi:hypothetical protein
MRCAIWLYVACNVVAVLATTASGIVPAGTPGDYNNNGLVDHADYVTVRDRMNTTSTLPNDVTPGSVTAADFDVYRAHYEGSIGGVPQSPFVFAITPRATAEGNVQWTVTFNGLTSSSPLGGHFSIRVDGPSDPNILSMTAGTSFDKMLPGNQTFPWLTLTDVDPHPTVTNLKPVGIQFNNPTNEAYAAIGSIDLPSTAPVNVLTLVTEGLQPTTLRVLGGTNMSVYAHIATTNGSNYYLSSDRVATFTPGDFSGDGIVNAVDIDMLASAAHNDADNPLYDLNDDGDVNFAIGTPGSPNPSDSDVLIYDILETRYGDANLNGEVYLADLAILAASYRQSGAFGWAQGNFDGSQEAGTTVSPQIFLNDLSVLATHWRFGVGSGGLSGAAVPEPSGLVMSLVSAIAALSLSVRR